MKTRLKAFAIHLGISLLILFVLLYVVVYIWYPPPFFAADGGWQGIQIIMGVDLILGPLLTLAVFNPEKPSKLLRRDLTIIAFIQISALVAGSWIVADQRTRLVMFVSDHFISMTEVLIRESGATPETLNALKTDRPAMGYIELPKDPQKRKLVILQSTQGIPLYKRGDLYRPLTVEARKEIAGYGYDLSETAQALPDLKPMVDKFLAKIGKTSAEVSAVPVYCRYGNPSLVIDRATGEFIDTINVSHDQLLSTQIVKGRKAVEAQNSN